MIEKGDEVDELVEALFLRVGVLVGATSLLLAGAGAVHPGLL